MFTTIVSNEVHLCMVQILLHTVKEQQNILKLECFQKFWIYKLRFSDFKHVDFEQMNISKKTVLVFGLRHKLEFNMHIVLNAHNKVIIAHKLSQVNGLLLNSHSRNYRNLVLNLQKAFSNLLV